MVRSASMAVATPCQTESNSSDFHKIATFLQSVAPILMPVALLTGRVYQDGLGGLRAVLFYYWKALRHQSKALHPQKTETRTRSAVRDPSRAPDLPH